MYTVAIAIITLYTPFILTANYSYMVLFCYTHGCAIADYTEEDP